MAMEILAVILVILVAAFVLGVWAGVSMQSASRLNSQNVRLLRIERKLDHILAHHGIQETSTILVDIREELLKGNKINAIKRYREQYDVGLREAKDAVDEMMETM